MLHWGPPAQAEGIGSFYEGMRLKMVQSVFASALMFTLKEEIDTAVRKALKATPSKKATGAKTS